MTVQKMASFSLELQNLITKIATNNGITQFEVKTNTSVSKEGDGYIGILEALYIIDKTSQKRLNLVTKKAPASENLRKQFPTRPAFLREIYVYEKLFPELKAFQIEHNIPHPFKAFTKMYGYITDEFKEVLLLENLKEDGFKLWNRLKPMDSNHLSIVMKTYARLHAISHAMKQLEPDRFNKITESIKDNLFATHFPHVQSNGNVEDNPALSGIMETFFVPTIQCLQNDTGLVKVLEKLKEKFVGLFFKNFKQHQFSVVTHCDCWSANILFKYEDELNQAVPTKVTLIDWQLSCLGSPIHDISYFFYISAGKEDLRNYQHFLQEYHNALSENISAFGLDPDTVYPYDTLQTQWQKYSILGFFMCLLMMQQTLSEKKTHDFEKMAEDGQDIFDARMKAGLNVSDLFKQRMRDLVEVLVDNGLIE